MTASSFCDRVSESSYAIGGMLLGSVIGVAVYDWIRTDLFGNVQLSALQERVYCLSLVAFTGLGTAYLAQWYGDSEESEGVGRRSGGGSRSHSPSLPPIRPAGPQVDPTKPAVSEAQFGSTEVKLINGDLTKQEVDAIVNAANAAMLGGGGIDGAIHSACGPGLEAECKKVTPVGGVRCPVGSAQITATGSDRDLPFRWVVHAVGPNLQVRRPANCDRLLKTAYLRSLEQAATKADIRKIGFCSISTGIFGYPIDEAAPIAISAIAEYVAANPGRFDEIRFCFYGNIPHRIWYEQALAAAASL